MRKLAISLSVLAVVHAGVGVVPAGAEVPGINGKIAYNRFDSTGESRVLISDPDETNESELTLPYPAFGPVWSPDGSRLLLTTFAPSGVRPLTVDPDGSDLTLLDVPEVPADFEITCRAWSPDGTRLLCQGIRFEGDHSMDGIYSIRASDGGDLTRLTVNPYPPTGEFGGGDIPGDFSPDGAQFVFMRAKPGSDPNARHQRGALFVANVDGSDLHQITPYGLPNSHDNGLARWSPDGSKILFASERGLLFVTHPDGAGLRRISLETGGGSSFAFAPGWSPDGSRIVFSLFLERIGQEDIYTANSDGSNLRMVTDTPDFEDLADWGAHFPTH
jgi:Tol biopolymer transport system component